MPLSTARSAFVTGLLLVCGCASVSASADAAAGTKRHLEGDWRGISPVFLEGDGVQLSLCAVGKLRAAECSDDCDAAVGEAAGRSIFDYFSIDQTIHQTEKTLGDGSRVLKTERSFTNIAGLRILTGLNILRRETDTDGTRYALGCVSLDYIRQCEERSPHRMIDHAQFAAFARTNIAKQMAPTIPTELVDLDRLGK